MTITQRRACVGFCLLASCAWAPPGLEYPHTPTGTATYELHGVQIDDPYRWLEKSAAPRVQAWTRAQNALTRSQLDRFAAQRAGLAQQLEELYAASIGSTPRIHGERCFHLKREGLQDHALLYVREGGLDAEPRVVLNPNEFSTDGTVALDWWFPSPDGALVAYGKSARGSELSTLHVRDVQTGRDLPDAIPNTRSATVAWDPDNAGFAYTRFPTPGSVPAGDENYHRKAYYHKIGGEWQQDPLLWGADRPKEEWPDVYNSGDDRYQFLAVERDWTSNDLYVRRMGTVDFQPVAVGLNSLIRGDVLDQQLFLFTNHEAPRCRIVVADVADPQPENWRTVIPEQKGVISEFALVDGKLVVNVLENAYSRLLIHDPDGKLLKEIELPTLGSVASVGGRPDRSDLFFRFESFAHPPVVFRYDLGAHTTQVLDRLEVNVDLDQYETQQVWFNSKDGTRVPMFVTHKKGLTLDGSNPTVLTGYGGFNISLTPRFRRETIPWLDCGGVWAVANIRGGGEFGQEWHLAAQLDKKQNCFDDFIAAAQKLIEDGYTQPQRLGAVGGSNGGLLMGAMITQRPDLFQAVYCSVPLLDMLRYHQFSTGQYYVSEYGDPVDPEHFKFLLAYSPYHNVNEGVEYPAVLFTAADSDTRVDPMHARKMAALMQARAASERPILLWIEPKAGHAGRPLHKTINQRVDLWTFFMWQLGVFEGPPTTMPTTSPA